MPNAGPGLKVVRIETIAYTAVKQVAVADRRTLTAELTYLVLAGMRATGYAALADHADTAVATAKKRRRVTAPSTQVVTPR